MWYFSEASMKLRYGDGRLIEDGITHTVTCEPILCQQGLHASHNLLDALSYAPGCILWQVELGGTVIKGDDKCCATSRTYLKHIDATSLLVEFAQWCSTRAADWAAEAAAEAAYWAAEAAAAGAAARAAGAAAWAAAEVARAAEREAQNKWLLEAVTKAFNHP
jgi:hypothetical protein